LCTCVWVWRAGVRAGTWSAPAQVALVCLGGAAGLCALVAMVASLPRRGDAADAAGNVGVRLRVRAVLSAVHAAMGSADDVSADGHVSEAAHTPSARDAASSSSRTTAPATVTSNAVDAAFAPTRTAAGECLDRAAVGLQCVTSAPAARRSRCAGLPRPAWRGRHLAATDAAVDEVGVEMASAEGEPGRPAAAAVAAGAAPAPVTAEVAAGVCAAVLATTPRWVVGVNVVWAALTVAAPLLHAALAVGVVDAVVGSRCTLASPTAGQGGASAGVASSVPGPLALCALALCGVAVVPAVCQVALLASGTGCGRGRGVVGAGALTAVAVALGHPTASAAAMAHGAGAQKRVASFGRALAACSVVPSLTSVLVGQRPVRPVARVGLWTLSLGAAMSVALWLTLVTGAVSGQLANGGLGIGLTLPVQTAADCTLVSLRGARWLALMVLVVDAACGLAQIAGFVVAGSLLRIRGWQTGNDPTAERLLPRGPPPSDHHLLTMATRDEPVMVGGVVFPPATLVPPRMVEHTDHELDRAAGMSTSSFADATVGSIGHAPAHGMPASASRDGAVFYGTIDGVGERDHAEAAEAGAHQERYAPLGAPHSASTYGDHGTFGDLAV
jgi:hypothetical protein